MNIFMRLFLGLAFFIVNASFPSMWFEPTNKIDSTKKEKEAQESESFAKQVDFLLKGKHINSQEKEILGIIKARGLKKLKKNETVIEEAQKRAIAIQKKFILQGPLTPDLNKPKEEINFKDYYLPPILSVDEKLSAEEAWQKARTENLQAALLYLIYKEELISDRFEDIWDDLKKEGKLTEELENNWYDAMNGKHA